MRDLVSVDYNFPLRVEIELRCEDLIVINLRSCTNLVELLSLVMLGGK